jgi:putative hydrolase of the HAD superfamily
MYKTIFFDIGGVLLNIYPDRTTDYLSSITNLTSQQIIDSFPEEDHHKYERGEISDDDFFAAIRNSLQNSNGLTKNKFWKAWSMMVGEKTEVVDVMERFTDNYSVWLLSNTNPYHIIKENRTNVFNKIHGAVYSYDVGYRKPEIEIYETALNMTNTQPENALFIDDLEENILAARSINIDAVHYTSYENLLENLTDRHLL